MICVECSAPTLTLYDKYKGNHIRLTICDNCHKVADKYIEYDKVLLFIDLMLLKPQAYKHTIYNMLMPEDTTMTEFRLNPSTSNPNTNGRTHHPYSHQHRSGNHNVNSKNNKYETYVYTESSNVTDTNNRHPETTKKRFSLNRLCLYWSAHLSSARLMILMLLFEVYLTWAYEEKNYIESGLTTSMVVQHVLKSFPVIFQYSFFLSQTILDTLVLDLSIQIMISWFLGFGEEQRIIFHSIGSGTGSVGDGVGVVSSGFNGSGYTGTGIATCGGGQVSQRTGSRNNNGGSATNSRTYSQANLHNITGNGNGNDNGSFNSDSKILTIGNQDKVRVFSRAYFCGIITITILVSNLIKLFPIVMLIWPYDNFILNVTRTLVQLIHVVILIEAIHIVLMRNDNNQYWKVSLIIISSHLIKFAVTHFTIVLFFAFTAGYEDSNFTVWNLLVDEVSQLRLKYHLIYELFNYIGV
ncbi:unnamed protein product [Ambrosiozyma monospora]|uniref:Unnamed protein product n=1 Tax=Ambrosiozyma monospora TaxID=43982 RepID=A0ACB5TAB6_AMBMO|nr:unnamed protein product [Ambrosiozyma monospora]